MRNTTIHLPLTHTSTISTARRPKLITVLAHFPHSFRSSTALGWAPMVVKRLRNLRSSRACWVRETFPRRRWRSSGRGCWSSLEAPALRATTRGGFWPPRDMPIYVIEPYFGGISIFLFGCHYCLSGELSPAFWQNFRAGRTPPIRSLFEKTADFNEETLYNPDLAHLFEKPIPLPGGTQRRRPQHRTAVHHHSSRAPQKGRALWVVVSGGSSL